MSTHQTPPSSSVGVHSPLEAMTLVREIANSSPIRVDDYRGETNLCKYCEESWAEIHWEQYVDNEAAILKNPNAINSYNRIRLVDEHHESDCLWVRANKIIRGL